MQLSTRICFVFACSTMMVNPGNGYPIEASSSEVRTDAVDEDVVLDLEENERPTRTIHNEGFQDVPEIGYSDFNYNNPHQGRTVFTFGYRPLYAKHPTPSGYDYSSMIAPGLNDPNAEPIYGISKKYPSHIKSVAVGLGKVFLYDTSIHGATSDPEWHYGPVPLAKHAFPLVQPYVVAPQNAAAPQYQAERY